MDILKALFNDKALTYDELVQAINAHNGDEANKEKLIKLGNIASGEYVSKEKLDRLQETLNGKTAELDNANGLIAELKKATEGNDGLQEKISGYETQVADLQAEIAEKGIRYAFNLLLMDAGVKDAESREFLIYKYEKQLKEQGKALELDENEHIKGGKDIVDELKTASPTHFETDGNNNRKVLENRLKPGDSGSATVTKEQFRAMTYEQRVALKQENEELYKQLAK